MEHPRPSRSLHCGKIASRQERSEQPVSRSRELLACVEEGTELAVVKEIVIREELGCEALVEG